MENIYTIFKQVFRLFFDCLVEQPSDKKEGVPSFYDVLADGMTTIKLAHELVSSSKNTGAVSGEKLEEFKESTVKNLTNCTYFFTSTPKMDHGFRCANLVRIFNDEFCEALDRAGKQYKEANSSEKK